MSLKKLKFERIEILNLFAYLLRNFSQFCKLNIQNTKTRFYELAM